MDSWKDMMKEKGIDIDAIRFSTRAEDEGCFIRALSSAAGVKATKPDYQERFTQIDRQNNTDYDFVSKLISRNLPTSILGKKIIERDLRFLRALPQKLYLRGTPLGKELHKMSMRQVMLSPRQIMEQIALGNNVIGILRLNDGKSIETHAAHLGAQDGNIKFLSDEGHPMLDTSKNISVNALILKKP